MDRSYPLALRIHQAVTRPVQQFWVTVLCLVAAVAACAPNPPMASDITGLWVERSDSPSRNGTSSCATIEFTSDGRFQASDLPEVYFILGGLPPTPRVQAEGDWELDLLDDNPQINLTFDPNPGSRYEWGYTSQLHIMKDGDGYLLYQWERDESERIVFVRQDEGDCDPAS